MTYFLLVVVGVILLICLSKILKRQKERKLKTLADQGDAQAQFDLAMMYLSVSYGKKIDDALQYFEKSIENGHLQAHVEMGKICFRGFNVYYKGSFRRDPERAIQLFLKPAEQGLVEAQYELGRCYNSKEKCSTQEALKWLQKAADQNHGKAQYELGVFYLRHCNDMEKAVHWCKKALENGEKSAEAILGFKAVEKNAKLEDRFDLIKEICIELIRKGYDLSDCYIEGHSEGAISANIYIYDVCGSEVGKMKFGSYGPSHNQSGIDDSNYFSAHLHGKHNHNHMIYLVKASIIITSKVHCDSPPPEWLVMCGRIIAPGFTIDFPDWARRLAGKGDSDPREYVNVVFR